MAARRRGKAFAGKVAAVACCAFSEDQSGLQIQLNICTTFWHSKTLESQKYLEARTSGVLGIPSGGKHQRRARGTCQYFKDSIAPVLPNPPVLWGKPCGHASDPATPRGKVFGPWSEIRHIFEESNLLISWGLLVVSRWSPGALLAVYWLLFAWSFGGLLVAVVVLVVVVILVVLLVVGFTVVVLPLFWDLRLHSLESWIHIKSKASYTRRCRGGSDSVRLQRPSACSTDTTAVNVGLTSSTLRRPLEKIT